MFVASSLYNYATGSSKAGPSSVPLTDTRVKRHPRKKNAGAANGHVQRPPPQATNAINGTGLRKDDVVLETNEEDARKATRSAADRAKIAVVDEIVKQEDLYRILGVKRNATVDEIRRGFLNRSRMCHPDKLPSYAPCVVAFQKVSLAYQTLSKPSSRRMYDVSGRSDLASALNGDGSASFASGSAGQYPGYDETLNSVLYSVFCEFLEGDFEMVRVLVNALNEGNPGLDLGEDTVDSIEGVFRKLREMLLAGKKYLTIIRFELIRLYEIQHSLRQLSYFDVFGRLRLTLQLARVTLSIPMAIDQAMKSDEGHEHNDGMDKPGRGASNEWARKEGQASDADDSSSNTSAHDHDTPDLDFGMCADPSDDDAEDDDVYDAHSGRYHHDADDDLLYGETRRDRRRRLRRVRRRERIAARRRAALEARHNAQQERQLQKRGLLGPTAASLLKGVVTVLETGEAWMPGGGAAAKTDA